MRLSRKQSSNATESPAVKLDKKTSKKYRRQSLARKKQAKNTAFYFILPIALSFYRYKNAPEAPLFLVFLPILPILPINCLT
jgi:hypothetical protein